MTIWTASVGEILDLSADALICSANPQLNLSGGVGGEFRLRYGESMQQYLHDWLRRSARRFVAPGTVVVAPSCGSPFRVVLHAVAIDAFYDTSADVIAQAYANAFAEASRMGCRTIASACLACGYGRATTANYKFVPTKVVFYLFSHWLAQVHAFQSRLEQHSRPTPKNAEMSSRRFGSLGELSGCQSG